MASTAGAARAASAHREHLPAWLLIAVLLSVSLVLQQTVLAEMDPVSDALPAPWWAIALAFAFAETFVVNLHFRSESGSFSLLEIPLVYGLFFAAPSAVWVAVIVGTAVSLKFVRGQPIVKVAFNVANLSLHVAVAATIFQAVLGDGDPLSPWGWLAAMTASLLSSLVEVIGISAVIGITEGHFSIRRAWNLQMFGLMVAGANTVQAIIAILVLDVEPLAGLLLVLSTAMLFAAYRAYASEREHREMVEFLYQSTRSLRKTAETEKAVKVLLEEASSMFRAEAVEMVLFPAPDSGEEPAGFTCRDGRTHPRTLTDIDLEGLERVVGLVGKSQLARKDRNDGPVQIQLARFGLTDAMIGVLRSDQRAIGVLVVGNRLGSVTSFSDEDLRLFDNLIEQSAVALENDQLEQALNRLRTLERELSHQARYDALTGLANRILFTSRLEEEVDGGASDELTLLYVDLDDFKLVNDQLGHSVGDALLVEVAHRIEEVVRPEDLVARLGGDEFSVMLLGAADPESIAYRIIASLSAPFLLGANEARIGASVGLATSERGKSASDLLHEADLAMYSAKSRGKGSVVWYSSELQSQQLKQQQLHTAIRRAISDNEFTAVFQPIVRLSDLSVVGAEALARWPRGVELAFTPDKFIPEAERSGLVIAIDRLIRRIALSQLPDILSASSEPFSVTVNVSARNLYRDSFTAEVAEDVLAFGVDPSNLVLEVTESAFAGDVASASASLQEIRDLGVRIALDDFGTGYSSLSYLRELPIDLLKIARPFVTDLTQDDDVSFVDVITHLGRTLALEIVAEGVEFPEQVDRLRRTDCHMAQGFLFARPMKLPDLLELRADPERIARAVVEAAESAG